MKLVAEGHEILAQSIDSLHKETRDGFDAVDQKFEIVFNELHLIRNELKEKVSRDEFLILEKRVMALERSKSRK